MRTYEEIIIDNLTKTQILLRELKDAAEEWQNERNNMGR